MIPYEDLDRALARWKARQAGGAGAEVMAEAIAEVQAESIPEQVDELGSGAVELVSDEP